MPAVAEHKTDFGTVGSELKKERPLAIGARNPLRPAADFDAFRRGMEARKMFFLKFFEEPRLRSVKL